VEHETLLLAAAAATLWGAAAFALFRSRRTGRAQVLAASAGAVTAAAVSSWQMNRLGDRVRDCMLSVVDLQDDRRGAASTPDDGEPYRLHPVADA
jgi:hypothetical protein